MSNQNAKSTPGWERVIDQGKVKLVPDSERVELVYKYRLLLQEKSHLEEAQKKWGNRGIGSAIKIMDYNEEGIPNNTPYLEVFTPESIRNLETYLNKPYGQKEEDWERVSVKGRSALRISLDKMSEEEREILLKTMNSVGISKDHIEESKRVAQHTSEKVKAGENTLRLLHPADLDRLEVMFDHVEGAAPQKGDKKEWRNLNNWQKQSVMTKEKVIEPRLVFNLDNLSLKEQEHMQAVLKDLSVEYTGAKGTNERPYNHLSVFGSEEVKKLRNFARLWTPQETMRANTKGARD